MGFTRPILALGLAAALCAGTPAMAERLYRVGVMINGAPEVPLTQLALGTLRKGFAALGYEEGRNLKLEPKYARGAIEKHRELAAELAAAEPDAILCLGGPAAVAAKNATTTIPIVYSIVTDPVALGLARTMEAPGGNLAGVTNLDRGQARAQMELLKEVVPGLARVAVVSDASLPGGDASGLAPIDRANVEAAGALGLEARVHKPRGPAPDLEAMFAEIAASGAHAVLVLDTPVTLAARPRIASMAAARKLPTVFPGGTADAGGMLTFGTTVMDTWMRMPALADRIFKGAAPGSVPVEVVTRRELVVNRKVALEVGVEVPEAVLRRADRVVE